MIEGGECACEKGEGRKGLDEGRREENKKTTCKKFGVGSWSNGEINRKDKRLREGSVPAWEEREEREMDYMKGKRKKRMRK